MRGHANSRVPLSQPTGVGHFLSGFSPSRCAARDVAFLCCRVVGWSEPCGDDQCEALLEDWDQSLAHRHTDLRTPAAAQQTVELLAKKHGVVGGKWMLFPALGEEADAAWDATVRAVAEGLLGPWVKISSVAPGMRSHVLFAYTSDFTDRADVERVRGELATRVLPLLADRRMQYKADCFSILGIYKGNDFGLRPTMFDWKPS